MTFQEMMAVFIEAFKEQAEAPGGKLMNNHRVKLLTQVSETLAPKVLSVATLMTAIEEMKFWTENEQEAVCIADLIEALEQQGISFRGN